MTNLERSWRNPESIVHADDATKIAALRKIADLYRDSLCYLPYNRGDVVTPGERTLFGDEGAPMLVVDVQLHPEPISSGNMQNGPAWGLKPDIRVARIDRSGDVTLIWCESYAFEPFADFEKRDAAKRVVAANAKGQAPYIDDLIWTRPAALAPRHHTGEVDHPWSAIHHEVVEDIASCLPRSPNRTSGQSP